MMANFAKTLAPLSLDLGAALSQQKEAEQQARDELQKLVDQTNKTLNPMDELAAKIATLTGPGGFGKYQIVNSTRIRSSRPPKNKLSSDMA
jgi:hypothetical protein